MATPLFTRSGSWSRTSSRFVFGGLLALSVIFGMLAMHSLHPVVSPTHQSTTADVLAKHVEGPSVVAAPVHDGHGSAEVVPCATCCQGELSMAGNCLAAVVLGLEVLLPGLPRAYGIMPPRRAGPQRGIDGVFLDRAPSLNVLCINRC